MTFSDLEDSPKGLCKSPHEGGCNQGHCEAPKIPRRSVELHVESELILERELSNFEF